MSITAFAIYAEDCREEVGNQYSLIGCFREHVTVDSFPCLFPRLVVMVSWMQSLDEERLPIKMRFLFRPESGADILELGEREVAIDRISVDKPDAAWIVSEAQIGLQGFVAPEPGTLGVRIQRGDQEFRLRGLPILTDGEAAIRVT